MYTIIRNDDEIDELMQWVAEASLSGSHYPRMSYEDGILAVVDWLTGVVDMRPDQDE